MISTLKNRIMVGVYLLYVIRKLKNPYILPFLFFGLFISTLSFLVSIPSVISNLILTGGSYSFVSDAFTKADLIVQVLVLMLFVCALIYLRKASLYTITFIRGKFV